MTEDLTLWQVGVKVAIACVITAVVVVGAFCAIRLLAAM
jgi:hypothetical protein